MGQYIQQGQRLMFETVVRFEPKGTFLIPDDPENVDGLNFLSGKPLSFVAEQALRGTILAHVDGGVPNILIRMPQISESSVGYLIYFFAVSYTHLDVYKRQVSQGHDRSFCPDGSGPGSAQDISRSRVQRFAMLLRRAARRGSTAEGATLRCV